MDNQKSNEGNARDLGREGSGASMGKDAGANRTGGAGSDMNKDMGMAKDTGKDMGKDTSANMNKDMNKDISKSATDMHKTIDKAAEAAQPVVDRLASTAHAGVDKVSGALTDASQRMDDKTRQLSEAYRHFADTGREYVRNSPATSVLVAIAAGWTLSKLLGRRH
jgi:ElaB/YqjD/DUF883 family membrane-anchored ribosome-binding protein